VGAPPVVDTSDDHRRLSSTSRHPEKIPTVRGNPWMIIYRNAGRPAQWHQRRRLHGVGGQPTDPRRRDQTPTSSGTRRGRDDPTCAAATSASYYKLRLARADPGGSTRRDGSVAVERRPLDQPDHEERQPTSLSMAPRVGPTLTIDAMQFPGRQRGAVQEKGHRRPSLSGAPLNRVTNCHLSRVRAGPIARHKPLVRGKRGSPGHQHRRPELLPTPGQERASAARYADAPRLGNAGPARITYADLDGVRNCLLQRQDGSSLRRRQGELSSSIRPTAFQ